MGSTLFRIKAKLLHFLLAKIFSEHHGKMLSCVTWLQEKRIQNCSYSAVQKFSQTISKLNKFVTITNQLTRDTIVVTHFLLTAYLEQKMAFCACFFS